MIYGFLVALAAFLLVFQQPAATVEQLVPEVVAVYPHDPNAYTQGLLLHDGLLYESTGRYGQSSVRQVELESGRVLRQIDLPNYVFGEGLALVDDRLIQITWREQIAITYDFDGFRAGSLQTAGLILYSGEGWGLCYDDSDIYMTDGSSTLFRRDAETFDVTAEIPVTLDGEPVARLNELECVGDSVYANIYTTDDIVRIDKATGQVTARINAAGLLTPEEIAALGQTDTLLSTLIFDSSAQRFIVDPVNEGGFVLNGIAYNPESDTFYITGKQWPKLFEVRFVAG